MKKKINYMCKGFVMTWLMNILHDFISQTYIMQHSTCGFTNKIMSVCAYKGSTKMYNPISAANTLLHHTTRRPT